MGRPDGQYGETPPLTGLAAEADALTRGRSCDGTDRHVLGWSGRMRAGMFGGAVALVVLLAVSGQFARFGVFAVGLLLGISLATAMSTSVVGDQLVVNRFGRRRRIPLASVSRVARYQYRSNLSLRLWDGNGHRLPSVPIGGLGYRISRAAAGHLLRYLDRPEVSWEPGAWQTLADAAGSASAPASSEDRPTPRGRVVAGKPLSGWRKAGLFLAAAASVAAVVVLIVLVPVTWHGYLESQRIQHGPEVLATLQNETVTAHSDRYGTHHTTHFRVTFVTESGQPVTTVVNAHGQYQQLPPGDEFHVRYDPHSPQHAELPGKPDNSLATALLVTVLAGVAIVTSVAVGPRIVRARRQLRRLPQGSGTDITLSR